MDLYIFTKTPFGRILRFHMMIQNPKFGNYLNLEHEDKAFLKSLVHISVYFNEKYTEKTYTREWIRNWKLFCIPDLREILHSLQWRKRMRLQQRPTAGLGALFG